MEVTLIASYSFLSYIWPFLSSHLTYVILFRNIYQTVCRSNLRQLVRHGRGRIIKEMYTSIYRFVRTDTTYVVFLKKNLKKPISLSEYINVIREAHLYNRRIYFIPRVRSAFRGTYYAHPLNMVPICETVSFSSTCLHSLINLCDMSAMHVVTINVDFVLFIVSKSSPRRVKMNQRKYN